MNIAHEPSGPSAAESVPVRDRLLELGIEPTALERPRAPETASRLRSSHESLGQLARKIFLAAMPALAVPGCIASHPDGPTESYGLDNGTVGKMDLPDGHPAHRSDRPS